MGSMRHASVLAVALLALQLAVAAMATTGDVDPNILPPDPTNPGPLEAPRPPPLPSLPTDQLLNGGKTPDAAPAPAPPQDAPADFSAIFAGVQLDDAALIGVAAAGVAALAIIGGAKYVNSENVLENEVRGQIYGFVRNGVGANLKQITEELHLSTTNAVWHLRKLEQSGLVRSRKFNGYKIYYPVEGGVRARDLSCSASTLTNGNARTVFEFVAANPGSHQREIARVLGVNHGTVRWHLKKLRQAGLLVETKAGKISTYFPTDIGKEAFSIVVRNSIRSETGFAQLAPASF